MPTVPRVTGPEVAPQAPPNAMLSPAGGDAAAFGGIQARMVGEAAVIAQRAVAIQAHEDKIRAAEEQRHAEEQRRAADHAQLIVTTNDARQRLADAQEQFGNGVLDGTIPKETADAEFRKTTAKVLEEASKALPQSRRAEALSNLQVDAANSARTVRRAVTLRDRQDVTSGITQTLEYLQRQYQKEPAKATAQAMETLDQLGPFSNLTPDQVAKLKQGWKEQTQELAAFTLVQGAKNSPKALDAAEAYIKSDALPDLDPRKREQYIGNIDAYRANLQHKAEVADRRAEVAAHKLEREQDRSFAIVSERARQGIPTDPMAPEMRVLAGSPYAAEVQRMTAQIGQRTAFAMLPLPDQRARIDALKVQQLQGTNKALDAEIKASEEVFAGRKSALKADPLRATAEVGLLGPGGVAPLDVANFDAMLKGLPVRVNQAATAGIQSGEAAAPLTPDEAAALSKQLSTMPAKQRAERLAQITAAVPPAQAGALARLLSGGQDDQSRALGYAMAYGNARTTQGRTVAEIMLKGAEALKAKTIKEETVAVDGWRGQIAEQVIPLFPNPQQAAAVAESARFILAGLVAEGASGSSSDAKQAVRLAIGGSTSDINGARVVIPAGVEESDVRARMRSMTPADIKAQSTDGRVYASGASMAAEDFLAKLPDAQLRYAGRGRYHVVAGGTLAATASGNPIVVEVPGAR